MPRGSFMIPFGSTMGSTLNTFNSYGQQFLKNQLDQQQMQLNQQRAGMEQQRLQMEAQQQNWDMQREKYNVQQQQAGWAANAQMFSRFGSLLSDPKQRMGADAMSNAAAKGVDPATMEKIAASFGLTDESKAMLNYYKDYWYYGKGRQAEETAGFVGDIRAGGSGTGAPTGYSGGAGAPPPPNPYGGGSGFGGGGGFPGGAPPNPFGAGMPPPPGGGSGPGGLPPGWAPVGHTDVSKHGMGWKVDPRDGRTYYINPDGTVIAPGPVMGGSGPGAGAGAGGGGGMGGGMAPPAPGSAFRPPPPNPLGTY